MSTLIGKLKTRTGIFKQGCCGGFFCDFGNVYIRKYVVHFI